MSLESTLPIDTSSAGIYTDFSGLARLKTQAANHAPQANKQVAQQFEALFIQMMLKTMRDASQLSDSSDGEQTRFYQEMFDKQIALELAADNGIGLAAAIERQLQALSPAQAEVKTFADEHEQHWRPENPDAFVRDLWPLAEEAHDAVDLR